MAHLAEVQYEGGVWVLPVHLRVEEDDLPGAHHDVQLLPTVPPTTVGSITTTGTLPETLSLHAYKKNAIDWAKNYVQLQEVDGSGKKNHGYKSHFYSLKNILAVVKLNFGTDKNNFKYFKLT